MEQDVTSLKDHLQILRRRWRVLLVGVVLGVGVGVGLSLQQPTLYTAEAEMQVKAQPTESDPAPVVTGDAAANEAQVLGSVAVAELVVEQLGLDESPDDLRDSVRIEVVDQTAVLAVRAERSDPDEAAEVANAFVNQYISYKSGQSVGQVERGEERIRNQLQNVRALLASTEQTLEQDELGDNERAAQQALVDELNARDAALQLDLLNANEVSDIVEPGELLVPADSPRQPSQPRVLRAGALGGILGLILGTLLAYARDRFDDGIRDEARLKSAVGVVPILGRMPEEPEKTTRPIALTSPHSPSSEGYRTLTTNIRFLTAAHSTEQRARGELLVVSSAVSGEGKTTVATNIAVTAARVGLKVLLVDADLRYPNVHEKFGIETPVGLTHLLADQGSFEDAVTEVDVGVGHMRIVGAGVVPPNPAELLAGPRAHTVWDQLRGLADLVVVDTAPILGVADTLEVSRQADLMLLVARYRASRVHQLQSTIERIRQVGGSVDGVVWAAIPGKVAVYGYTSGRATDKGSQ